MKRVVKPIHRSRMIAFGCVGIVIGVSLSPSYTSWISPLWVFLFGCIGLIAALMWHRAVMIPIILVAGMLIGGWRGAIDQHDLADYQDFYRQTVRITGGVADDPIVDASGLTIVVLQGIAINGQQQRVGTVRVSAKYPTPIKRSDYVTIEGTLLPGFGTYAGSMYRGAIVSLQEPSPPDVARHLRDVFVEAVRKAVPDPEALLGIGFLTGQKSALPPDLLEALQISGLTHIVVASGYNLTILVRLSRRLLSRVSRLTAFTGSILLVITMIGITGLSPSMTRAGLVTGLSLVTWYYGRHFHPLVLLPFAAALTVLIQPSYAWGDLGWMLSFTAFAGVMILAPVLQKFFFGDSPPGTLRQILGETVAAHLATLPVLVVSFGTLSNVAVFANLMIVPLVPLAMLLTFIAGMGVLMTSFIAPIIGQPVYWLLQYMVRTAEWWALLPWAQFDLKLDAWVGVMLYLFLIVITLLLWRVTKFSFRSASIIE